MATFTATAFKWTGTYYNSQYNTSYTVEITDNDGTYQGGSDSDEMISIDGASATASEAQPYVIDVSFTDTGGNNHVEKFNFFKTDGDWYFIPGADSEFTVGANLGTYQSHTQGWDYSSVVCFSAGTMIETIHGPKPVETLIKGDEIVVADGGSRRLCLNLRRDLSGYELWKNEKLRPVLISKDALGVGIPNADLRVSRQHRMLVTSSIAHRMFGSNAALVAAIHLTELPGCYVVNDHNPISYFHLVFDDHQIVVANGSLSESFYPGPDALRAIPQDTVDELKTIFPVIGTEGIPVKPARFMPPPKQQKRLIARHSKNEKPLSTAV